MQKQYEFSEDNILRLSEKTVKKDDGINSVLVLLKDLRDFQGKVNSCLEDQTVLENRQRIEKHKQSLNAMYDDLIEVASGGVRDIHNRPESQEQNSGEELPSELTPQSPEMEANPPKIVPTI